MKTLVAAAPFDDVPKVVREKRRQDRNHLVSLALVLGVFCGCTMYLVSKLGLSPF